MSRSLSQLVPAYMPALVLFVIFPLAIYLPNAADFDDTDVIFGIFAALCVLSVAFISLVGLFTEPVRGIVVKSLFFLGCYILLADIVAPVQVDVLMAGTELRQIYEPPIFTWLQAGLFAAMLLAIVFVLWTEMVRTLCASIVVVLFLIHAGLLVPHVLGSLAGRINADAQPVEEVLASGNVYHVIFDSYGPDFVDHAREIGRLDEFDGFVHFEAMTNAVYTELSLPSFMSGILPGRDPDGFMAWRSKWLGSDGLVGRLHSAGYQIAEYQANRWRFPQARRAVGGEDVADRIGGDRDSILFVELVLLRAAPNFIKQSVFPDGRGVLSTAWATWLVDSGQMHPDQASKLLWGHYTRGPTALALLRQLMEDEASRPATGQYVYGHVLLPHSPYNVDRNLEVRGVPTSWHEQSLASVNLMAEIVATLKELGRYEDSTIIFQGDHGLETWDKDWDPSMHPGLPESVFKDPRTLLLIKPAGEAGSELRTSERQAQLLDIVPTVLDLFGWEADEFEGYALFGEQFPSTRAVHVLGYEPPRQPTFELQHYVLTAQGKWVRRSNVLPLETTWDYEDESS